MNKNRMRGIRCRTSWLATSKSKSIKGTGCRSGGRVRKVGRFKERVRELTSRTRGVSIQRMAEDLSRYLRGWIGYFGKCETPSVLVGLEAWLRRRLRSAIWKQWKRGTVRFAELRKRGVGENLAGQTAGTALGPWRLANSPALSIALSNAYFDSLGIPRLTVQPIA